MSVQLEVVEATAPPPVWASLRNQAHAAAQAEPALASLLNAVILSHDSLTDAMSYQLARKLGDQELRAMSAREFCDAAYRSDVALAQAMEADLKAVFERDPACKSYVQPFLFFKGFQALQTYRVANWLWRQGRDTLAFYLQSRMSEVFQVDIHPAAVFGKGVFLDHGTGIVVGETAVVGDDVSMLHGVTLGGTGAERGGGRTKIGNDVLLGAGAKVLGNIKIGEYAKIASGSVVLKPVPPHCTAAGVPARLVNCPTCEEPARTMDHTLADVVYDYVI
jgi:serine O-acetyltransferase